MLAVAAGCTSSASPAASPTTEAVAVAPLPCSSYAVGAKPDRCLTPAEKRAQRLAAQRQAHAVRAAEARVAARKKKREDAEIAAAVAATREANAWHQGYDGPAGDNLDIYYKDITGSRNCADFATDGCWTFEVITENGCSYLDLRLNETQNGAIVGDVLANQLNVPSHTPVILELDADQANVKGSNLSFTCY